MINKAINGLVIRKYRIYIIIIKKKEKKVEIKNVLDIVNDLCGRLFDHLMI